MAKMHPVEDEKPVAKKAAPKAEHRVSSAISKLVELKNSPSGLKDRDAVLAALVDAVIEQGGGGRADVDSATEIEGN